VDRCLLAFAHFIHQKQSNPIASLLRPPPIAQLASPPSLFYIVISLPYHLPLLPSPLSLSLPVQEGKKKLFPVATLPHFSTPLLHPTSHPSLASPPSPSTASRPKDSK